MPRRYKKLWASQMVEIATAVRLLSRPQGASIQELEDELGVGGRTIYRMKKTLEALIDAPLNEIEGDVSSEKRWQYPDNFTFKFPMTRELGLETPELIALYLLRMNSGLFSGSSIAKDLDSAFTKIGTALSPAARTMLDNYSRLFVSIPKTPKDYSDHTEIIEELSIAMLERLTCTVTYATFSEDDVTEKRYNINPLHFFERDGGLYIFAIITRYNDIRLLAVERIRDIDLTNHQFDWPEGFDPAELLHSAFGLFLNDPVTVRIRFTPSQARYIKERQWAKTQSITDEPDGSVILTMETSGRYEIKRWVMSFGRDAELLAPPDLRESIRKDMAAMATYYQ